MSARTIELIKDVSDQVQELQTDMLVLANQYDENRKKLQAKLTNATARLTTLISIASDE